MAVLADVVVLLADRDVMVALGAHVLEPDRLALATVALGHGPRARQCIVDRRDLVAQYVRIGVVEGDSLLDDRLVVFVQRNAAGIVGPGALHAPRLEDERVVMAVPVLVFPFADGIAQERGFERFGPFAAVGIDA